MEDKEKNNRTLEKILEKPKIDKNNLTSEEQARIRERRERGKDLDGHKGRY